MKSFEPSLLWTFGALQRPDRPGRRRSVARLFTVVSLLLLTSPTAFASNLFLDPGEAGTLVPKPYMGGHGFRYDFAEQTGKFIIEDLDGAGNIQSRATLDFDGTILGEPSWIIEIGTSSGLFNVNEAMGDLVLPPGVGGDGTVESLHAVTLDVIGWGWGGNQIIWNPGDGLWVFIGDNPDGFHASLPGPVLTATPALVKFTNHTGSLVDVHSLVPEPPTLIVLLLASAVLLTRGRRRAMWGIF